MTHIPKHSAQETGAEKAKIWDPSDSLNKFQASMDYTVNLASRNKSTKQQNNAHFTHSFDIYLYEYIWIKYRNIYTYIERDKVRF